MNGKGTKLFLTFRSGDSNPRFEFSWKVRVMRSNQNKLLKEIGLYLPWAIRALIFWAESWTLQVDNWQLMTTITPRLTSNFHCVCQCFLKNKDKELDSERFVNPLQMHVLIINWSTMGWNNFWVSINILNSYATDRFHEIILPFKKTGTAVIR